LTTGHQSRGRRAGLAGDNQCRSRAPPGAGSAAARAAGPARPAPGRVASPTRGGAPGRQHLHVMERKGTTMNDWKTAAQALADELAASGAVRDPGWRAAFAVIPRQVFVPRFYALDGYNQPRTLLHGDDPARRGEWLRQVYRNQVLVTRYRVAGTMPDESQVRVATSSASMPSLVAMMLDRLAVTDGHSVLEIGTGTGYNA